MHYTVSSRFYTFIDRSGDARDLHRLGRRQRQMCISDSWILSVGTFISRYFLLRASRTALMRKSRRSRIARRSASIFGLAAITASDLRTISCSSSPFLKRVEPVDTRSQIASARPILGAISTEPLISWMSALMLFLSRKSWRLTGSVVYTHLTLLTINSG